MASNLSASVTARGVSSGQVWAATISSVLGWSLDLFDLFIILFIAPTIGPLFFPSSSPTLSLASVYAAFAVTLLMRPVGSAVFGSYADRLGRKRTLVITIFGIGISTALLGALPTVHQAGIIAPIGFVVVRLIQGVFVGGVVASTHTLGTETIAPRLRGMFSGVMASGAGLGGLFASIDFAVVSALFPGEAFNQWGWRVMFFSALISAVLCFFAFRAVEESPLWRQSTRQGVQKTPVRTVFSRANRSLVIVNLMITIGTGATYYLTAGFLPTYLAKINLLPKPAAAEVLIISSVVMILASPLWGHVSEIVGRKPALIATALLNIFAVPALFLLLTGLRNDERGLIIVVASAITMFGNFGCCLALVYLNERFPTAIRSSGTGLCWNIGFAAGGIMPTFVALASSSIAAIPHVLIAFIIVFNIIFLIGAIITPETRGHFG